MKNRMLGRWAALMLIGASAAWADRMALGQDEAEPPKNPVQRAIEIVGASGGGERNLVLALADDEADQPESSYRLGVQVAVVPELAKKQLSIDDGLAVEEVVSDSPAAKAELKKFDILVKAGDAPLKNGADLVKAINASDGKEITIVIVRDGKTQSIKVTPDKRAKPEGVETVKRAITAANPEVAGEIKQLEEALQKLKTKAGKDGVGFWFAKPAVVTPRVDVRIPEMKQAQKASDMIVLNWKVDLPKNMSVQITKEGNQAAKIRVKWDDKEWEVTEDKLKELPDEVRRYAGRMLGQLPGPGMAGRVVHITPAGKVEGDVQIAPQPPRPPVPPKPVTGPQAPTPPKPPMAQANRAMTVRTHRGEADADAKLDAIIKKLDERSETIEKLDKKVEELQKEIDQLRKK